MTLEEFRRFADTWGGDIERWPHPCRAEAKQCAATQDGEAILQDAQRLDTLLATAPLVTSERTSRAAFAVVQQIAAEAVQGSRQSSWGPPAWLMPAASVVCSALIGVSLAMMVPYRPSGQPTLVLSAILGTGSMGWVIQ
jgi:hypothetical protein